MGRARGMLASITPFEGLVSDFDFVTLTQDLSDQAIGAPVDPHSMLNSASESGGAWNLDLDQSGITQGRDEVDELCRYMFDPAVVFADVDGFSLTNGEWAILFEAIKNTWPASGSRLCMGMGMVSESGTGGTLAGVGAGWEDQNASNDLIGHCRELLWSPVDTFVGRATSVRGLWIPNGDPSVGNFGSIAIQAVRTSGGSVVQYDTTLNGANASVQTGPFRMFFGAGFRATGASVSEVLEMQLRAAAVRWHPAGWPEG